MLASLQTVLITPRIIIKSLSFVRILFVTSEAYPLIKTGGLADVSGSLPAALRGLGADIRILIPGYQQVIDKLPDARPVAHIDNLPLIGAVTLMLAEMPDTGVPVYIIHCPSLYQRAGGPYLDASGRDWEDNPLRFGILSRVAAILSCRNSPLSDWIPDILHCNDWQSGLAPAYLHYMPDTHARSMISLHNLAFQGCYPAHWVERLWLPTESYQMHGLEYHHQLSFLKAGIYYADSITTVSPTYAREIQTSQYGFGLEGLLASRAHEIHGILNGIETQEWNPATDPYLVTQYDDRHLDNKNAVKNALQSQLGLSVNTETPLLGVVSRLTHQKGLDMFLSVAETVLQQGCQIALLGGGEAVLEQGFKALALLYPNQVSVNIGYNEPLSHQIMAGVDIFIMPSRFEPCGLNQMYGLRYGTPPVVTPTGGLADSVVDTNAETLRNGTATGFVMDAPAPGALLSSIEHALAYYRNQKSWRKIQRNGMRLDLGWAHSAQAYIALYQQLMGQ
ncbi:starch synthase [Methylophilaceae bacterium]|nr:starch synthase [Methylophilaceae bacterium]